MSRGFAYNTIVRYAARWSVRVLEVPESRKIMRGLRLERHGYEPERYSTGSARWHLAYWSTTPIIVEERYGSKGWPWLLHELAHATCPVDPETCEELEDTMGFEILSILHLRLPMRDWEAWQDEYQLDTYVGCVYASNWLRAPPNWR